MAGGFEQPERGERAGDGAYGVHQAFEAEGAAVGVGRDVGGEQGFLRWRAHAPAKPRSSAAKQHMMSVHCERERSRRKSCESVAKDG